jgi:hypothetical protein
MSTCALLLLGRALTGADGPEPRACHALAYHEALEEVVLFGGASACGTTVIDERRLWGWDGARWTVLADGGPSPREDALLAYDSRRKVLMLYGGRTRASVHADTWEWDGTTWRELETKQCPGPIEHAAAAFDATRGRVVVFGGAVGGSASGATWEWDGEDWSRGPDPGPPARVGHGLTRSGSDGRVVLFGGFDPNAGSFRDLWRWEGAGWQMLESEAPIVTEGHAVAGTRGDLIVVGLAPDDTLPEGPFLTMRFRESRWTGVAGSAPPRRVGAALAYDARRDTVVLFGGHDLHAHRSLADVWELSTAGWRAVSPELKR